MQNPFRSISKFHSRFSFRDITLLWYRSYRRVFLVFFTLVLIAGAWYWYYNLYQYSWDEKAKKSFLDSYAQETDFKHAVFEKAVSVSQERQRRHETGISLGHDLFRLEIIPEEKKESR